MQSPFLKGARSARLAASTIRPQTRTVANLATFKSPQVFNEPNVRATASTFSLLQLVE